MTPETILGVLGVTALLASIPLTTLAVVRAFARPKRRQPWPTQF